MLNESSVILGEVHFSYAIHFAPLIQPLIGECYIQEHTLYKELAKVIDPLNIKRWYRPQWLCGLELDFYFEANGKKFALEYQGAQHVRPVKYFGGKIAFKKQISKDRRKLKLCLASDVKLLN